jgi:hypothetical protein
MRLVGVEFAINAEVWGPEAPVVAGTGFRSAEPRPPQPSRAGLLHAPCLDLAQQPERDVRSVQPERELPGALKCADHDGPTSIGPR